MKKILFSLFIVLVFSMTSFAAGERYIVFFAETLDIPAQVIDKMLYSKRFCMVIPIIPGQKIPEPLEELVSSGKLETSLSFDPEPVFPILASAYSSSIKRSGVQKGFNDFIDLNVTKFSEAVNKETFGFFLDSAKLSHNTLYYFSSLKVPWINIDNMEEDFKGSYIVDGITTFAIYDNFPTNQKDIMKWLGNRKEDIIPVRLSKKHLNNTEFMTSLIDLFDNSKYIKPSVPLYINFVNRDMIPQKKNINFKQMTLKGAILTKLYAAASSIEEYKNSENFSEQFYNNAQSELVYLCSYELLKDLIANKSASQRMFDAAYNNIFRLLGMPVPDEQDMLKEDIKGEVKSGQEEAYQTEISADENGGISIVNSGGIVTGLNVFPGKDTVNIKISFDNAKLTNIVFKHIDIYIDMNNFEGAGATTMLPGTEGFLTPDSAWEYAIRIKGDKALLYRHSGEGASFLAEFPVANNNIAITQKYIRGNPINWGYQVIVVSQKEEEVNIADFFNQSTQPKSIFLATKPFQISAVRIRK